MAANKMDFVHLVKPTTVKPKSQRWMSEMPVFLGMSTSFFVMLRDQFNISTWLAFGALFQAGLCLAFGSLAFLPAVLFILYRIADTFLMAVGLKRNHLMDGVIMNKFSAQFPDAQGNFGNKPANDQIVCFLIGAKNNSPLGILAEGAQYLGEAFDRMIKYCEKNADDFGFLGASSWIAMDRTSGNEFMTVMYFRSSEGLHKFAHHDIHRQGWNWWNKNISKMPHQSIWHEVYEAPKGSWESIYVNSHPTLLSGTVFKAQAPEKSIEGVDTSKPFYITPIVDARRGLLRTSAGRMSQSQANEHNKYNDDPYENYGKLGY